MKINIRTRTWKIGLFAVGIVFIFAYLLAVYFVIGKISTNERRQVQAWANTVQQKADIVNYTEYYFKQIRAEERRRVEVLAKAYRYISLSSINDTDDINNFFMDIILNNKNIPIVWVDREMRILSANNVNFNPDTVKYLKGDLLRTFSQYPPIEIELAFPGTVPELQYLFYTNSHLYSELYRVLDELSQSFFDETADNIASVPVIITDSSREIIYATGNIPDNKLKNDSTYLVHLLHKMASQNSPIIVKLAEQDSRYVYYMDSEIISLIRVFPFIQLIVLILIIFLAYIVFTVARNSEQNQVWAGMAKETAHQLGTPISSMMAWIELLKMQEGNEEIARELEKDIDRLHVVADRFSKIGSIPVMDYQNIVPIIQETLNYLRKRISSQIVINFYHPDHPVCTFVNLQLFSWIIENLTRNAVDAMSASGTFTVEISEHGKQIFIDFTDTGKGIPRNMQKQIFSPGFTTKKRGWGLGLTLVKRILSDSKGKIFVKTSTIGVGTTFRIILQKCD